MFVIRHTALVRAPIERCFELATSIELVEQELRMTPVSGRTSGHVEDGDTVRWEGRQLGFRQFHVSEIRHFNPPHGFQDRMVAGRFRSFEHDHRFTEVEGGTRMDDEIRFSLPWSIVGWLVAALVMRPHIVRLLRRRFVRIKRLAEGTGWQRYVEG